MALLVIYVYCFVASQNYYFVYLLLVYLRLLDAVKRGQYSAEG